MHRRTFLFFFTTLASLSTSLKAWARSDDAAPKMVKKRALRTTAVPQGEIAVIDGIPGRNTGTANPAPRPVILRRPSEAVSRALLKLRDLDIEPSPRSGEVYATLTAANLQVRGRAHIATSGGTSIRWLPGRTLDTGYIEIHRFHSCINFDSLIWIEVSTTRPDMNLLMELICKHQEESYLDVSPDTTSQNIRFGPMRGNQMVPSSIVLRCPAADKYTVAVWPEYSDAERNQERRSVTMELHECRFTVL